MRVAFSEIVGVTAGDMKIITPAKAAAPSAKSPAKAAGIRRRSHPSFLRCVVGLRVAVVGSKTGVGLCNAALNSRVLAKRFALSS